MSCNRKQFRDKPRPAQRACPRLDTLEARNAPIPLLDLFGMSSVLLGSTALLWNPFGGDAASYSAVEVAPPPSGRVTAEQARAPAPAGAPSFAPAPSFVDQAFASLSASAGTSASTDTSNTDGLVPAHAAGGLFDSLFPPHHKAAAPKNLPNTPIPGGHPAYAAAVHAHQVDDSTNAARLPTPYSFAAQPGATDGEVPTFNVPITTLTTGPSGVAETDAAPIEGHTITMGPGLRGHSPLLQSPPTPTPEQAARLQWATQHSNLPGPSLAGTPDPRLVGNTPPSEAAPAQDMRGDASTFDFFRFSQNTAPVLSSTVGEPSVGSVGRASFETGNWYASVSGNYGTDFGYVNPFTEFSTTGDFSGGFCCDQRVATDIGHGTVLWYLQYVKTGSGSNDVGPARIAVFNGQNNLLDNNWCVYDILPTNIAFPRGLWLDFPHFQVSNNFLYVTTNLFNTTNDVYNNSAMWRMPLSSLETCSAWSGPVWSSIGGSIALSNGATTTMYAAVQVNATTIRIFDQPEANTSLNPHTVGGLSNTFGGTHNSFFNGINWTSFSDERIQSGFITPGNVWFMWNSAQNAVFGRPQPFVRIVEVNTSTFGVTSNVDYWHPDYAWHYSAAAVNDRGHWAGPIYVGGGTWGAPQVNFLIWDDFTGGGIPNIGGVQGNNASSRWGDFVDAARHQVFTNTWLASAYVMFGSTAVPYYFWFGRDRDNPNRLSGVPHVGNTLATAQNTGITATGGTYGITTALWEPATGRRNVHMYRLDAARSGVISATTNLPPGGDTVNTMLRLFNSAGTEVAFNDDCGGTVYSCIGYVVPAAGTYYVGVSGFNNRFYNPTVAGSGVGGSIGDYRLTLSFTAPAADPPLNASPRTVTPTEGQEFTGVVASFTDGDPRGVPSDYVATINWGDSTSSAGIIGGGPSFTVTGTHAYAEEGSYPVTVNIRDNNSFFDTGGSTATANSTANVGDAALSATAATYDQPVGTEGFAISNLTLAYFSDAGGPEVVGNYSATINWNDGTPNTSGVISRNGTQFSVAGSHTYAEEDPRNVVVTITDDGGSTASVTVPITLYDAALSPTALPISATERTAFSGVVATFIDTGGPEVLADYSATIDWGDGTAPTAGTIGGGPTFTVTGSHTYAEEGSYVVSITVNHETTGTCIFETTATVADAALTASGTPVSATEGAVFNGNVASFTDTAGAENLSDYTALIDWGDGSTPTAGKIDGSLNVSGSHTYPEEGTYTVTTTITDEGGSTITVTSTATVGDAPLQAVGTNFSGTAGVDPGSISLAYFADAGGPEPAGNYAVSVNWGDLTPLDTGTVNGPGPLFSVTGDHVYAVAGTYTVTVTVTDDGGSTITVTLTATIS
jgi:hypothetical protein